jgi:hypothetical protein
VSGKITNCTNRIWIKNTGQYLHRVKRKWENEVKKNSKLQIVKKNVK